MNRFSASHFFFRVLVGMVGIGSLVAAGSIFAAPAEPSPAAPETSVSLRGAAGGSIEVGEPLRIAVRINLPDENSAKLTLAPAKGSWVEATTVEILSSDGKRVVATARAASTAESSVVIDQEAAAHGLWWISGDNMAALAAGNYLVRAKLVVRDGEGWKGESVSEPAELSVVAPTNDPERVTQRILARAHAAVLEDAPAKAAEMLDEVLTRNPDDIPILEMRAALCLSGGNPASAYVCINRARTLAARQGGHPSGQLHAFAARIEAAMTNNAAASEPEVWSTAPRSVFAAIRPTAAEIAARTDKVSATGSEKKIATTAPSVFTPPQKPASVSAPAVVPGASAVAGAGVGVVVPARDLADDKIIADANGQWAATATARTEYDKNQYSAKRATGAPDVKVAGNSPDSWCPATRGEGIDWLDLTFAKPVHAVEVRVRQNDAPGAIVKVEAFEPDGTAHVWWEGVDPYQPPRVREIAWFVLRVPKTPYLVARVKLTLNLASGSGYKEIDAVQLVSAP
jgi:hypothetical protein